MTDKTTLNGNLEVLRDLLRRHEGAFRFARAIAGLPDAGTEEAAEKAQAERDVAALTAAIRCVQSLIESDPPASQSRAPRVFVDLDGVVVDFDRYRDERGLTGDQVKAMPGAYLEMPAIPGAIEAVRSLIGMGYEVWLATKPPTGIPHAYSDKAAWVLRHLPELKRRIIITHDKGLLGCERDFLCDDRPHKANCEQFRGTLLSFTDGYHWPQALVLFREHAKRRAWTKSTAVARAEAPEDDSRQKDPPLIQMEIRTRHPEHYLLVNENDGTKWRISSTGHWKNADSVPPAAASPAVDSAQAGV